MDPSRTLHDALRTNGLGSRKATIAGMKVMVLVQGKRGIGSMRADVGWCLVRILEQEPTTDYTKEQIKAARRLFAGLDKP